MSKTGYLTPDAIPNVIWRCILVPDDETLFAAMDGALSELTKTWNWEKFGAVSVEDTVQFWRELLEEYWSKKMGCVSIGTIVAWPVIPVPDNYLIASGQFVSQADYPDLFNVIGYTYGGAPPTMFKLPNLQDKFIVGSGLSASLNSTGGENQHVLTEAEMPQHVHQYNQPLPQPVIQGELVPQPVSGTGMGVNITSVAGGNQPHENRPEYHALLWCIVAK